MLETVHLILLAPKGTDMVKWACIQGELSISHQERPLPQQGASICQVLLISKSNINCVFLILRPRVCFIPISHGSGTERNSVITGYKTGKWAIQGGCPSALEILIQ